MPTKWFGRIALLALLVVICQGTWVLAGTTGALSGRVVLSDGSALADANVTAISPSESLTTKTDANGHFAFVSPSRLTMHVQFGYDLNPRTTMRLTVANLVDRCVGGTSEPWVTGGNHFCSYGVGLAAIPAVGNFYNPRDTIQRFVKFPYDPASLTQPINA